MVMSNVYMMMYISSMSQSSCAFDFVCVDFVHFLYSPTSTSPHQAPLHQPLPPRLPLYIAEQSTLHPLRPVLNLRISQTLQVSRKPELCSLGPQQMHSLLVHLINAPSRGDGPADIDRHARARARQDLVHARKDLLGGSREGEFQHGHRIRGQPGGRVAERRGCRCRCR